MKVCVFCASSPGLSPEHAAAAAELGRWIGASGHTLVWGGCNVGLMDILGRAVREAGGWTVAVVPRFLLDRGLGFEGAGEQVVTADLRERKAAMRARADAFVALPGGVGTWEEFFEVLALKKLGQLDRPIVLANLHGCYDPLLAQLAQSVEEGFNPPDLARLFDVVDSSADLLGCLGRVSTVRWQAPVDR
jgi:uncharacterized protein (TIGR00730 family)